MLIVSARSSPGMRTRILSSLRVAACLTAALWLLSDSIRSDMRPLESAMMVLLLISIEVVVKGRREVCRPCQLKLLAKLRQTKQRLPSCLLALALRCQPASLEEVPEDD